jgi:hypothetical protein
MERRLRRAHLGIAAALAPAVHCHPLHGGDPVPCVAFMLLAMTRVRDFDEKCADSSVPGSAQRFLMTDPPLNLRRLRVRSTSNAADVTAALATRPHHHQIRELDVSLDEPLAPSEVEPLLAALNGARCLRVLRVRGHAGEALALATRATLRRLSLSENNNNPDFSVFPELRRLDDDFFGGSTDLTTVAFPPRLRCVGNRVFWSSGLTTLDMSALAELKHIGDAFCRYAALKSVQLPPNLETIGDHAFRMSKLTAIDVSMLPKLRKIGMRFCAQCANLTAVSAAPPNLQYIGHESFARCASMAGTPAWAGVLSACVAFTHACGKGND